MKIDKFTDRHTPTWWKNRVLKLAEMYNEQQTRGYYPELVPQLRQAERQERRRHMWTDYEKVYELRFVV